jgi:hypothetical protein
MDIETIAPVLRGAGSDPTAPALDTQIHDAIDLDLDIEGDLDSRGVRFGHGILDGTVSAPI